ncbi:MAG: 8-amino-7-oxononanoate synthase [Deltaproteobacteria bacterium]|nr:8-amino-7-oxononanoate synthase [Deltaproteobacteria bacterium]
MSLTFNEELDRLTEAGLRRSMTVVESAQGPRVNINGRDTLLLCSNDYLGLANHPALKEAARAAIGKYGVGSGASRLVSGTMEPHVALEGRIARFKDAPSALLFNSGYHANIGAITALAHRHTEIFSDRLNHASIVDACILSRAKVHRYQNRDVDGLERLLKRSKARRKLVVTDGVFSMDGTIAPLVDVAGLLDRYNAMLLLDDAHATGVLGTHGKGTLEHLGVPAHPSIIQMGTLGKAAGSFGAFIAGDKALIDLLVSTSRPFIYTTALPPAACAASIAAIDIIEGEPQRRRNLLDNAAFVRDALAHAGFDTLGSESQIIPILIGDPVKTMTVTKRLLDRGVFIQGIRPPTVPDGTSRLRVSLSASHARADLEFALSMIIEAMNEQG